MAGWLGWGGGDGKSSTHREFPLPLRLRAIRWDGAQLGAAAVAAAAVRFGADVRPDAAGAWKGAPSPVSAPARARQGGWAGVGARAAAAGGRGLPASFKRRTSRVRQARYLKFCQDYNGESCCIPGHDLEDQVQFENLIDELGPGCKNPMMYPEARRRRARPTRRPGPRRCIERPARAGAPPAARPSRALLRTTAGAEPCLGRDPAGEAASACCPPAPATSQLPVDNQLPADAPPRRAASPTQIRYFYCLGCDPQQPTFTDDTAATITICRSFVSKLWSDPSYDECGVMQSNDCPSN